MNISDAQRVNGWLTAVRTLHEQPAWRWVFGWGPETFRAVYRLGRTQHAAALIGYERVADHVHNLPLELLVTVGVVGTAAIGYLGWRLWKEADSEGRAAMAGLLIMSMVEPIFFAPAAMLFLLLGVTRQDSLPVCQEKPFLARVCALALAVLCLGVWVDDFVDSRRNLRLHPRESEANQLAVVNALQHGKFTLALIHARRAARADPANPHITEQTAKLEAYLK